MKSAQVFPGRPGGYPPGLPGNTCVLDLEIGAVVLSCAPQIFCPGKTALRRPQRSDSSSALDRSIENLGLEVLKTPYRSPKANALCERLIGSIRRECLDFMMPLSERHLLRVLKLWRDHYNHSRPHMGLDAGIPSPPVGLPAPLCTSRHWLPAELTVTSRAVLGALHHHYGLTVCAA